MNSRKKVQSFNVSLFESCTTKTDICEIIEETYFAITAPTRKSFSAKFKIDALKYVTEKGYSNSAAAKHFAIDEKNIR